MITVAGRSVLHLAVPAWRGSNRSPHLTVSRHGGGWSWLAFVRLARAAWPLCPFWGRGDPDPAGRSSLDVVRRACGQSGTGIHDDLGSPGDRRGERAPLPPAPGGADVRQQAEQHRLAHSRLRHPVRRPADQVRPGTATGHRSERPSHSGPSAVGAQHARAGGRPARCSRKATTTSTAS
jgi:hypothetical protein